MGKKFSQDSFTLYNFTLFFFYSYDSMKMALKGGF